MDAFEGLSDVDQRAVVAFLRSLKMPLMDGNPLPQADGSPHAPKPGTN